MVLQINTTEVKHPPQFWLFSLLLLSAAAIAGSDGLLELPEHYRMPLSEVVYEEHTTWRATPEDDNGWRKDDGDLIHQGQRRKEVLPRWDYDEQRDRTLDNIFMNEGELAKPKTNVFKYNF